MKCCERDHNNDGNCDIHSAPGVLRVVGLPAMRIVSRSEFMGLDEKRRQRGGTPAIVECNGIRFFSLAARDLNEASRMNAAADKLVFEGRVFRPE